MRANPASRHVEFHHLMEALGKSGCPLCRLSSEMSRRWLRSLFHEQVNDVTTRQRLRRAGAFCARHTGEALEVGDPLGSSILYGDLLRNALEVFPHGWAPACPLCEQQDRRSHAMLELLLQHLDEPDLRAAYENSDGLCLPHLQEALRDHRHPGANVLVAIERQRMAMLAEECAGFVAKSDYHHHGDLTAGEAKAWKRSARKLGGGCAERDA